MSAEELTAELMRQTRPQIIAWMRTRGIPVIHLTYYAKKHLVAYAVRQAQQSEQAVAVATAR